MKGENSVRIEILFLNVSFPTDSTAVPNWSE